MSDIVERLRKGHAIYDYDDDCLAAAAEIESLRSRLAESLREYDKARDDIQEREKAIAALQDELAEAKAKAETAQAGYIAAVTQSNWQARTNNELNMLQRKLADIEAERALLVTRAENAEAALVAEVAKNGRHAMRVTIAQLEARLQKVMARCADLLDEDQFNELDAIASSASGVQYKPCEICTTQSWCETHGCQCYPTEAMCCLDYPRCDCNSPPEPDDEVTK